MENGNAGNAAGMSKRKLILLISVIVAVIALAVAAVFITISILGSEDDPAPDGDRTSGVYCSVGGKECELTLKESGEFILRYGEDVFAGVYLLEGSSLTLDFDKEGMEDVAALLDGGVVSLTLDGAALRLIRKVEYTVKFNTGGGSELPDVNVMNGHALTAPADPTRDGYLFVGWYGDSEFKKPYTFSSDVVTSDITLYARWIEDTGVAEHTVRFELGYGIEELSPVTTLAGRVFGAPVPEREGFDFLGWWISTDNDAARPSYQLTEKTVLCSDTTVFALWRQMGGTALEPVSVTVGDDGISWTTVEGARSYTVTLTDSVGTVLISRSVSTGGVDVAFADYPAGAYRIEVVANSNTGAEDNSCAYYTYVNKGLDKVSGIFVSDGRVLVYGGVPNAERYLVTVVCGNAEHNHTDFDNGDSKTFSFANCPMTQEGIRFTVTAVADGYLSSTSDELVYRPELGAVEGLVWDAEEAVVSWSAVEGAELYMVSVLCGDKHHSHDFISNGNKTYIDLKGCLAGADGITVRVYPVSEGYASPSPTEITVNKTAIRTPDGITVTGTIASWRGVEGAAGYEIEIDGVVYTTEDTHFDLCSVSLGEIGSRIGIRVRAMGEDPSAWSNILYCNNGSAPGGLGYSDGYLYWNYVIGADGYEISVNGGEIITVEGACRVPIRLDKAGENILRLRFVKGEDRSEWATVAVSAYTVVFDTLGGTAVQSVFAAEGEHISLPLTERVGYEFISWYNVPGGPAVNGKEIDERFFTVSGDTVLYAHYTPKKYEIIYNYGTGGTGSGSVGTVEYEREYSLEVPKANELTVSFGGWFEYPHGKGTQYTDATGKSLIPWDLTEGKELHAFWIDETLVFTPVKVGGKAAYSVSAGARIALVAEVTVPAYHNGLPVAMVDGAAFSGCRALRVINLPSSIEVISSLDPFGGCDSLVSINVYIPNGETEGRYTSIDGVLFEHAPDGVALLRMPEGRVGEYAVPSGTSEILAAAFTSSSLTRVSVCDDVRKIGNDAFRASSSLTSVTFADSVTGEEQELVIGKRTFAFCTSLVNITLPSRLAEIELSKYYLNTSGGFTPSGDFAFVGCTSLENIGVAKGSATYKVIDGMIYSATDSLLYCPIAKEGAVRIPAGTQSIGAGAFVGCNGITEVFIPSTVTYVGEYAFTGTPFDKLTFGGKGFSSVTIGDRAFFRCEELSEVIFEPGGRTSVIGTGAFAGCASLESFTITSSVTEIRDGAFEGCVALMSVGFEGGKGALEFGKNVFKGCVGLTTVNIPYNVSKIPGIFSGCTSLTEVRIDENNPYFVSHDGVVFTKDMTEIVYYPEGKGGEYTIPESVSSIAAGVFAANKSLTKLVIPNTVSYIGEEAFRDTDIGMIVFSGTEFAEELVVARAAFERARFEGYDFVLPAHTKHIGDYAFSEIFYKKIVLNEGVETLGSHAFYCPSNPDGAPLVIPASVVSIGEYCFSGETLASSYVTAHRFMTVVFTRTDSRLTEIGDYAFYKNARIAAVRLPDSVKTVGNYAFYECVGLTDLTLSSSLETIGAYAFAASANTYQVPISTLSIPASVHTIGARAFENCQLLSSVTFEGTAASPDLTLGVAYRRSYETDGIEAFSIERGNVFASCTSLLVVKLSPNVVALGDYSFAKAGSTGFRVEVPEDSRLATVGAFCFYKSALTSFTVPPTVRNLDPIEEYGSLYNRTGIGDYAFAVSSGRLTEIVFLDDGSSYPLTIGYGAFENQSHLESIELPARLTSYVGADGTAIPPLANGALVFYGARSLSKITARDGGAYRVEGGILYTSDMKELVYCPAALSADVSIPSVVVRINDYAFYGCSGITSVSFTGKSDLTSIGDYAFYACSSLKSIALPSGVLTLGEGAFASATSLESITLSRALTEFDIATLEGCSALKSVLVEAGNSALISHGGVLYSADGTSLILYPRGRDAREYTVRAGTLLIGDNAFAGNGYLEAVVLPVSLTDIGERAFFTCTALNTAPIPTSVESIGAYAFGNTVSLTGLEFVMGAGETLVIGDGAFMGSGVSSLVLPARLAYIGNIAFRSSKLSSLQFEDGAEHRLAEIGNHAFAGTLLVSVKFPSGLVSLGDGAFLGAFKLESVVFGEGLESIGNEAFSSSSLKVISLPASLKTLGTSAFSGCAQLEAVAFAPGAQLEVIPTGCFLGCTSLKSVTVPRLVREIGGAKSNGAFEGCSALVSVVFESADFCTLIGDYAFFGCSALKGIDIPLTVGTLGNYAFGNCTSLSEITLHRGTVELGDGLFSGCTSLASIEMNTGADRLGACTFENCLSLTHLYIPSGVTDIADDCFRGSSVESFDIAKENKSFVSVSGIIYNSSRTAIVYFPPRFNSTTLIIPKEIVEIKNSNFRYCTGIKDVIFEEGGTSPLTIGSYAFDGCYQIRSVKLPERLVSIGSYAFRECYGLNSITIPKNVTEIGYAAFSKCAKLYEVKNESPIENITKDTYLDYINLNSLIGAKVNVINGTEGSSVIIREGDFAFTTVGGVKRLIGYYGFESEITLPEGDYELAPYIFSHDESVTRVIVPKGVGMGGSFMFEECNNLEMILLMDEAVSDSYGSNWNNGRPYVTGFTGEEITYTLMTGDAPSTEPIASVYPIELPTPVRDGYVFMGWYVSPELSGDAITGSYYASRSVTLYASFMEEDEYIERYLRGQSIEYAYGIESGITYTVDIRAKGAQNYFTITVDAGESWNIATPSGMGYHKLWIYDEDGEVILTYTSGVSDPEYEINYDHVFEDGGTYFIGVGYKDSKRNPGSFEITFTKGE